MFNKKKGHWGRPRPHYRRDDPSNPGQPGGQDDHRDDGQRLEGNSKPGGEQGDQGREENRGGTGSQPEGQQQNPQQGARQNDSRQGGGQRGQADNRRPDDRGQDGQQQNRQQNQRPDNRQNIRNDRQHDQRQQEARQHGGQQNQQSNRRPGDNRNDNRGNRNDRQRDQRQQEARQHGGQQNQQSNRRPGDNRNDSRGNRNDGQRRDGNRQDDRNRGGRRNDAHRNDGINHRNDGQFNRQQNQNKGGGQRQDNRSSEGRNRQRDGRNRDGHRNDGQRGGRHDNQPRRDKVDIRTIYEKKEKPVVDFHKDRELRDMVMPDDLVTPVVVARGPQDEASLPLCPICNIVIRNPYTSIKHSATGQPAHFDCVIKDLSKEHYSKLGKGKSVYYVGAGNFAIVRETYDKRGHLRGYEVVEKILYEKRED